MRRNANRPTPDEPTPDDSPRQPSLFDPAPPMHHRFLLAAAMLTATACSGYNLDAQRTATEPSSLEPGGGACVAVGDAPVTSVDDPAAAASALACGAESRVPFESAVLVFDAWDPMMAAAAVIRCAESEACGPDRPAGLGLFAFAADELPPSVDVATGAGTPEALAGLFAARLDAARVTLDQRTSALDPERQEIYVDLPASVARELGAMRTTFGDAVERLDRVRPTAEAELAQGGLSIATATELRATRSSYVPDCVARAGMTVLECLTGPIARQATELLFRGAIASRDGPAANVEFELLTLGPDRASFMAALAARQAELRVIASQNHAGATQALADGASPEDVDALYGPTADAAADPELPWAPAPVPAAAEIRPLAIHVLGLVEDVDAGDAGTELEFHRVQISPDEFDCTEADVERVLWAERRVEIEDCNDFGGSRRIRPDAVVLVDGARPIVEGMVVEIWVDRETREGRLSRAYASEDARVPSLLSTFAADE